MLARILVAVGTVGSSVGFMFIGIGQAVEGDLDRMVQLGFILLIAGAVIALLGALMYRSAERAAEALVAHQNQLRGNRPDAGYHN